MSNATPPFTVISEVIEAVRATGNSIAIEGQHATLRVYLLTDGATMFCINGADVNETAASAMFDYIYNCG
jgi:hypothetical protein